MKPKPSLQKQIMQRSQINPAIIQDLLDSAPNAADKGQSQFFTPLEFGRQLATALPAFRGTVVDLNCGNGNLLHAAANKTTTQLLGSDIDNLRLTVDARPKDAGDPRQSPFVNRQSPAASKITKDLTLLYPLLREVKWSADLFALNPPWGLLWHADRLEALASSELPAVRRAWKQLVESRGVESKGGKALAPAVRLSTLNSQPSTIDSTLATLMIALDLCTPYGEGLLIANEATLHRLIFAENAPAAALAAHVWAHVVLPGNPMTGLDDCKWAREEQFHTAVIYFARAHTTGPKELRVESGRVECPNTKALASRLSTLNSQLSTSLQRLRDHRQGSAIHQYLACESTLDRWSIVKEHLRDSERNTPHAPFNLWLGGGVIQTHLSRFEQASVKVDKNECARLHALNGKTPMQLVLQRNEREELVHVAHEGGWRVDPHLLTAIEHAIRQYHAARAPLYPLPEIQRLGYLDESDLIECKADLAIDDLRLTIDERAESESSAYDVYGLPEEPRPARQSSIVNRKLEVIFHKGQMYPLRTQTVPIERTTWKPNALTGESEEFEYTGQELAIFIEDADGREHCFMEAKLMHDEHTKIPESRRRSSSQLRVESRGVSSQDNAPAARLSTLNSQLSPIDFTLQQLCAHFLIPEVPDVAAADPARYAQNLELLDQLEQLTA